jgi:hypothetical protein
LDRAAAHIPVFSYISAGHAVPDLAFVDGGLEAEIELLERFTNRAVR